MKNIRLIALCVLSAAFFASCGKDGETTYKSFVGTWGVERIHYSSYNTNWEGQPIAGSMVEKTYVYDPNDFDNGIHMVFKEDQTCEIRDSDIDSLPVVQGNDTVYILCPDTTLVYRYNYSYDSNREVLYMTENDLPASVLRISNMTANSFEYENTYHQDADNRVYVEKAYLKRISNTAVKSPESKAGQQHQRKPGTLLDKR